jgi:hypothetical protein
MPLQSLYPWIPGPVLRTVPERQVVLEFKLRHYQKMSLYTGECGIFVAKVRSEKNRLGHRRKLLMPPNLAITNGVAKCNDVGVAV